MQPELEELKEQLSEIEADVKIMLVLLKGNDIDKNDAGLIGKVRDLNHRIDKLEKFKDKAIYIIIGFSIGAGYAISDIINKFFK